MDARVADAPSPADDRGAAVGLKAYLSGLAARLREVPPAWVRCELLALQPGPRFVRVELIEHDEGGGKLAQASGGCWPGVHRRVEEGFAALGLRLEPGTKVLVKLGARLDANFGFRVEVLAADHQNKPDLGASIARQWFDRDGVDLIVDVGNSAVALAVGGVCRDKDRAYVNSTGGTTELTGRQCAPTTVHWTYDTWMLAHSTGAAMVKAGGDSWFFITADYAFGTALERDTADDLSEGFCAWGVNDFCLAKMATGYSRPSASSRGPRSFFAFGKASSLPFAQSIVPPTSSTRTLSASARRCSSGVARWLCWWRFARLAISPSGSAPV